MYTRFKKAVSVMLGRPAKGELYRNASSTVEKAKAAGLSVGEYVEMTWDQKGGSAEVISNVHRLVELEKLRRVLEVGGGTGRYIEKLLAFRNIEQIVSYEIAKDWSDYLVSRYKPILIEREADGKTLKFESDNSMDACFAHGVFVYLPFLQCLEYFNEMVRVTRSGGYIIIDVYIYEAFEGKLLNTWLNSPERYPVVFGKQFLIDFFGERQVQLAGDFRNKHGHSFSTYLIFKKD